MSLKVELLGRFMNDERNLIQKRKLNWLKLGGENSSFFYRFLAAKKRKNLIAELVDKDCSILLSFWEMEELIMKFYTALYTKSVGAGAFPAHLNWGKVNSL